MVFIEERLEVGVWAKGSGGVEIRRSLRRDGRLQMGWKAADETRECWR
jgi:hypothetical protein